MTKQEKMIFCTLFDSNYLDKGLALYLSMKRHISTFKLYIFAFDEKSFEVLKSMKLKNVVVLSVEDIMTGRLREIRRERSRAEFCWTCTPFILEYVLLRYGEKACTYIDADIYFFSDPAELIGEVISAGKSVGLVEHKFRRDSEYGSNIFNVGKYCIQFNTFLNDTKGMEVLENWKECCLEWCYFRYEDGKLGDQKYPDKWKQKYSCIFECENLGAGVAPWNLHLYKYVGKRNEEIWMECRGNSFRMIFYHFEGMKYLNDGSIDLRLWEPGVLGTSRKVNVIYGEYFSMIAFVRRYLAEKYGISFEQMILDAHSFRSKNCSLKELCKVNGILEGVRKWEAYWVNGVVDADKYAKEKGKTVCFCRKK